MRFSGRTSRENKEGKDRQTDGRMDGGREGGREVGFLFS